MSEKINTVSGTKEREIVLAALLTSEKEEGQSSQVIRRTLDRYQDLPQSQRAFIKRLFEGVTERRIELDERIGRFSSKPVEKLRPVVRMILRMGCYQLYYMDAVPDAAVCNESVRLVRKKGMASLSGFVNGILRQMARSKNEETKDGGVKFLQDSSSEKVHEKTIQNNTSLLYSMPSWIVQMWQKTYGDEETEAMLRSFMEIRPVTMRMDERLPRQEREALLTALQEKGVQIEKGRWLSYCYRLTNTGSLAKLPGFTEGKWTVQDESSMMVTEAAGICTGREQILDVCAAPGGKSLHMATRLCAAAERAEEKVKAKTVAAGAAENAENAEDADRQENITSAGNLQVRSEDEAADRQKTALKHGMVYSCDLTAKKTARIRENAERLRLSNITVQEQDATVYVPVWKEQMDIVLCDLPCSGLGVLGKKRDIKYHVTPKQLEELAALQRRILQNAVQYVCPGGVLIYSTCTIDRAENEEMAAWIQESLGLHPDSLLPYLPENIPGISGEDHHMLQLLPHIHGTDGFFLARFRK